MTSYEEPRVIVITMAPKELRDLADQCEEAARKVTLGQECFVTFLTYNKDYAIKLMFDQERTKGSPNFKHE